MLHFNVIHRPEATSEAMLEAFQYQVNAARSRGLKATNLLSYLGLTNPKVIDICKDAYETHGDEPGIHFHEYAGPEFEKHIQTRETTFWLNSMENKRRIVDLFMETFEKHFGFLPASIGSYYIDAPTMAYIKDTYPTVECAIATCFQEGTNMFRGTGANWHLFNEGGPWWPWMPSKGHILCPATDADNAIDVVALPHLVRDMVMSINDRNDYFASHPGNVMRGKAYAGPETTYDLNFIDQYALQDRYNGGYAYYNIFVSLPWVTGKYAQEEKIEHVRGMYERELDHLATLKDEGKARDGTMKDFSDWFRANRDTEAMSSCYWQDILCGSGREAFWQFSHTYRVCIDSALGGAICDLRPYVGQLDRPTGPDGAGLWVGSYPFLCNAHKRGGEPARYGRPSMIGTAISDGTHMVNLSNYRIPMQAYDHATQTLTLEPKRIRIGERQVTLQTRYQFKTTTIELQTTLLDGAPADGLTVTHYVSGAHGWTEYPEDIRDISLFADDGERTTQIDVRYASVSHTVTPPKCVRATIPELNVEVSLTPIDGADSGLIEDEHMFCPYFNLSLSGHLTDGGSLASCLNIKRLK